LIKFYFEFPRADASNQLRLTAFETVRLMMRIQVCCYFTSCRLVARSLAFRLRKVCNCSQVDEALHLRGLDPSFQVLQR